MITIFTWKKVTGDYQVFPVTYTYDTSFGGQLATGQSNDLGQQVTYGPDPQYGGQLTYENNNNFGDNVVYTAG